MVEIARAGHHVTGLDISSAMLVRRTPALRRIARVHSNRQEVHRRVIDNGWVRLQEIATTSGQRDVGLGDLGQGLPFRSHAFDAAARGAPTTLHRVVRPISRFPRRSLNNDAQFIAEPTRS